MKVTVNGQLYEITNKDEFLSQCAELLAPELAKQVQNNIVMMSLIDTAAMVSGIDYSVSGNEITVSSDKDYSHYIEYGTMGGKVKYASSATKKFAESGRYTLSLADARGLKKKYMTPATRELVKQTSFKGMVPFAPFRRVFYSAKMIRSIADKTLNK